MDTSSECQCDNTNSVKYIIEHKEYSLFETRSFSDKDSEEFLLFASPEQIINLSKVNLYHIFRYARSNPEELREEILVPLLDKGFIPTYDIAVVFINKDMASHLEILLSKYEYTQDQYLELWDTGSAKCQKIVSKYFNNEAKDKLQEEYVSEKKSIWIGMAILTAINITFAMIFMAMVITGIVFLSVPINDYAGGILVAIGLSCMISFCLPLTFCNASCVREHIAKLRSCKEILEPNYIMV